MKPALFVSPRGVAFPLLKLHKLELCFADGTLLWLRQVSEDPLRRSMDLQGQEVQVDLRALVPTLEAEVMQAHEADRPGIIFFTLRQHFKSADAFAQQVRQHVAARGAA